MARGHEARHERVPGLLLHLLRQHLTLPLGLGPPPGRGCIPLHLRTKLYIKKQLTLIYAAVGLYDTHSLNGIFSLRSYVKKIVKQFVFLVQSIVFLHMFLKF